MKPAQKQFYTNVRIHLYICVLIPLRANTCFDLWLFLFFFLPFLGISSSDEYDVEDTELDRVNGASVFISLFLGAAKGSLLTGGATKEGAGPPSRGWAGSHSLPSSTEDENII